MCSSVRDVLVYLITKQLKNEQCQTDAPFFLPLPKESLLIELLYHLMLLAIEVVLPRATLLHRGALVGRYEWQHPPSKLTPHLEAGHKRPEGDHVSELMRLKRDLDALHGILQ